MHLVIQKAKIALLRNEIKRPQLAIIDSQKTRGLKIIDLVINKLVATSAIIIIKPITLTITIERELITKYAQLRQQRHLGITSVATEFLNVFLQLRLIKFLPFWTMNNINRDQSELNLIYKQFYENLMVYFHVFQKISPIFFFATELRKFSLTSIDQIYKFGFNFQYLELFNKQKISKKQEMTKKVQKNMAKRSQISTFVSENAIRDYFSKIKSPIGFTFSTRKTSAKEFVYVHCPASGCKYYLSWCHRLNESSSMYHLIHYDQKHNHQKQVNDKKSVKTQTKPMYRRRLIKKAQKQRKNRALKAAQEKQKLNKPNKQKKQIKQEITNNEETAAATKNYTAEELNQIASWQQQMLRAHIFHFMNQITNQVRPQLHSDQYFIPEIIKFANTDIGKAAFYLQQYKLNVLYQQSQINNTIKLEQNPPNQYYARNEQYAPKEQYAPYEQQAAYEQQAPREQIRDQDSYWITDSRQRPFVKVQEEEVQYYSDQ